MNRFIQALQFERTDKIFPVLARLRRENFDLPITIVKSEYETLYRINLIYSSEARVSNLINVPEKHIKDSLIKKISWQLYGDAEHLVNGIISALYRDDKEEALEMCRALMNEIKGE